MRDTRYENGSALILAVVLTSLLAIVGVLFLLTSRVDKMTTSAISENRELNMAIEAVIAQIEQELVLDVPHSDPNRAAEEYYDYPDDHDAWLASLEPYEYGPADYRWKHRTDLYDNFDQASGPGWNPKIVPDYAEIVLDLPEPPEADADADGVSDSWWVELPHITSSKGWPIYVAVRVIDPGAMINVNTLYADPGGDDERRGDLLTDIYIDGLVKSSGDQISKFLANRSGDPTITKAGAEQYDYEVSRRQENPGDVNSPYVYTLYDISEELSLRNRFMLFPEGTMTRLEAGTEEDPDRCLSTTLRWSGYGNAYTPYTDTDFDDWKRRFNPFDEGLEPNNNNYDFRHLLTTYNADRVIAPDGEKMLNVNDYVDKYALRDRITKALVKTVDPNAYPVSAAAAQMAANLIDYHDDEIVDAVTAVDDVDGFIYYGFERPCVYISELVYAEGANSVGRSYAIELHKPYAADSDPNRLQWQLQIDNSIVGVNDVSGPIDWSGTSRFHVIRLDPSGLLDGFVDFNDPNDPNDPNASDPNVQVGFGGWAAGEILFDLGSIINLQRLVLETGQYITVDSVEVPAWLVAPAGTRSFQRDINLHKPIRRLWDETAGYAASQTLGRSNFFEHPDANVIQAHPENADFVGIGDIGKVFAVDAYWIGPNDIEEDVRINLVYPHYQQVFNYLTVFDPAGDVINNDGDDWIDESDPNKTPEWKIFGRININTAPWYVMAQLPWMTPEIAQAINYYRDGPHGPFGSIAQLSEVDEVHTTMYSGPIFSMYYYGRDDGPYAGDETGFPDLTAGDGAADDLEERDLIFARISNLVTVRSDVFTAYILVRIGTDGPQKRVIAILDRSNVYYDPVTKKTVGEVKVVALHPVPDPR